MTMDITVLPPQDIEAEQAVLGAIILESDALKRIDLAPEDFYKPSHVVIYQSMLNVQKRNEAVDIVTLTHDLKKRNKLDAAGGIVYLSLLANSIPTAANILYHARIVQDKAKRRGIMRDAQKMIQDVTSGELELQDLYARYRDVSGRLARAGANTTVNMSEIARRVDKHLERRYQIKSDVSGVSSGYRDLDLITDGWQAGELIVIGARPGHGKTAFVLDMARKSGVPVGIVSLEMSEMQLGIRILASMTGIELTRLRKAYINRDEWPMITQELGRMSELPIFFDFRVRKISEIERAAARMVESQGIEMLVMDYIQLAGGEDIRRNRIREEEIAEISRGLKKIASDYQIPVIGLSQLSRDVEKRGDKRPILADLRNSGQIEQDADVVIFLWKADFKSKECMTEVSIAKGRNIETGTVRLWFDGPRMTYKDVGG